MFLQRKNIVDYTAHSLKELAALIKADWQPSQSHPAFPYLEAILSLKSIEDNYHADTGLSVVSYFLGNARSWKSSTAYYIKKELNKRVDQYNKKLREKKI